MKRLMTFLSHSTLIMLPTSYSSAARAKFAQNCVDLIKEYDFDGKMTGTSSDSSARLESNLVCCPRTLCLSSTRNR